MDLTVISTYRATRSADVLHLEKPDGPEEEVSLETRSKLPGGFDNLNVRGRAHSAARPERNRGPAVPEGPDPGDQLQRPASGEAVPIIRKYPQDQGTLSAWRAMRPQQRHPR